MQSGLVIGFAALLIHLLRPCAIEPVIRGILAEAAELRPPGYGTAFLVDFGSFVPMATAVVGREVSVDEIADLAEEGYRGGARMEVLDCSPNNARCEVAGDAVLIEVLDFDLRATRTLTITVAYSFTDRRASGAVAICSRWERLTFESGAEWTHRETQTVRRC